MAVKKRFSGKVTFDQMLESDEEENVRNVLGKPFQAGGKKKYAQTLPMFIACKEQ